MSARWREGNRVRLLENGEQYYPRVFAAIEAAREEVLLETFILFEDKVGQKLRALLIDAARRGVKVVATVDGFGSAELSRAFVAGLIEAGVKLRVFGPSRRWLRLRLNMFRRLHRKLVVVDRRVAYVGGINFSADHMADYGDNAKQDYAVELEGPVVEDVHGFLHQVLRPSRRRLRFWRQAPEDYPEAVVPETELEAGKIAVRDPEHEPRLKPDAHARVLAHSDDAGITFLQRDNERSRTAIERGYRAAIRLAEREIVIANAYFFPGYRLLRDLRNAARRGVEVHLILQGRPDEPFAMYAARTLYRYLTDAGVRIHEYCRRPLHGKVAVFDRETSTVGSSNLDPLSLALNLEANVFIRDRTIAQALHGHLETLVEHYCEEIDPGGLERLTLWQKIRNFLFFHGARRFPAWAGLLPAHTPRVGLLKAVRKEQREPRPESGHDRERDAA